MTSNSALQEAERECRQLAKSHYENFLVATVFLPRRLHQPFYNVYAFCRRADDLADESPSPEIALKNLERFQLHLDDAFAGNPHENLFIALANTVRQFNLPQQPFDDLLSAFRQDQTKTRYGSHDELCDYCERSANPVGRIVLRLAGSFNEQNAQLSDEICTGLQLANFWQDVARDFSIGRVYLPKDQMDQFSVDESMLQGATTPQPLRDLLRQQCETAEGYFIRGLALADHVPNWFSRDVKLFAHGGLATLEAIRDIDFDVLRIRPKVTKWKQASLVARALIGSI